MNKIVLSNSELRVRVSVELILINTEKTIKNQETKINFQFKRKTS